MIILGVAAWMVFSAWREQRAAYHEHDHEHHHQHCHGHDETRHIDTGHGVVILSIFEYGVPIQSFTFAREGDVLRSTDSIPEPHAFTARMTIGHKGHAQAFDVTFSEDDHGHDHGDDHGGLDVSDPGYQDAHERAHANDIKARFANRKVTTWQIVLFGLTGGLIPCPASITVLLLCLQLKQVALGATLVLCFSIGLAVTMVTVGVVAALGMRHAEKRWAGGFASFARKAPYASGALISIVGVVLAWQAVAALIEAG